MHRSERTIETFVEEAQFKLIISLCYLASLIATTGYLCATGRSVGIVLISMASVHAVFMSLLALKDFIRGFYLLLYSPVFMVAIPVQYFRAQRYLREFSQNQREEVVIVLGHPDWLRFDGWNKPIFYTSELKSLVKYLKAKGQNFSFYPQANFADVEGIMGDSSVKEVYFFGHGNAHEFELATGQSLYYCDFNDPKFRKEFVHQVHCGDAQGKSLVDYVVPEINKSKCFLFRKPITAYHIIKEFKRRHDETIRRVGTDRGSTQ